MGVWTFLRFPMFCLLVLTSALVTAAVQTLTIDSQLGTSIEDCFERITIGERLPLSAINRNVSELTTRECEQICKQDKQCQSYDYGVGAKGNATCNLSKYGDIELKDIKLLRNPDYDVYLRRIACEQSPPNPPPQNDEQDGGPIHRPVFRPVDEEPKRPVDHISADDFARPGDSRPIETNFKPGYRPQNNRYDAPNRPPRPSYDGYRPGFPENNHLDDRPDEYSNQKPDNDQGVSYGLHRPQDIPLPQRPLNNGRPKPDPYDVINFHAPYGRLPPLNDPGLWRPDPYFPPTQDDDIYDTYGPKPVRPNYPERPSKDKPNYHYIVRPNRKPYQDIPRPQPDFGYGPLRPSHDYAPTGQGYGQTGLIGPANHYPYRPQIPLGDEYYKPPEKPSYSYNSQYASSYGGSSYSDQDNYIYLEINDPPRPQKPLKPINDRPSSGYVVQNDRPAYGVQNDRPSSAYGVQNDRPSSGYGVQNDKPSSGYGVQNDRPSSGYGVQNDRPSSGYGVQNDRPSSGYGVQNDRPSSDYGVQNGKPSSAYGVQNDGPSSGYGVQNDRPSSSYGVQNDRPSSVYGVQNGKPNTGYGVQNDRPSSGYGVQNERPSSGHNRPNSEYGVQNYRPSSGSGIQNYRPSSGYGVQNDRPNSEYGIQNTRPSTSHGVHNNRPSSGYEVQNDRPNSGYGVHNDRPSSGYEVQNDKPSTGYGQNEDQHQRPSSGYGVQNDRPSSGYDQNDHFSGHHSDLQHFDSSHNQFSGYGQNGYDRPSYRPPKPAYGGLPNYGQNDPGYGQSSSTYAQSYDGHSPSYSGQTNQLGAPIPHHQTDKLSYGNTNQGYGTQTSNSPNSQSYGSSGPYNERPDEAYENDVPESDNEGYKNSNHVRPNKDGKPKPRPEKPSANASDHNWLEVKPVYEHDVNRPINVPNYLIGPNGEIVTSRPVSVSDYGRKPGGKHPMREMDYKACFRRVLAGKRALRSHVRRVAPCERLEDCRRECSSEKRFHCESFNYKLDPSFRGKGLCELMTKPIEAFDIQHDFVEDKNFDFYELDRNSLEPHCLENLKGPGSLHSGFLSSKPDNWIASDEKWDRYDYRGGPRPWDRGDSRLGVRRGYQEPYIPYQIGMARSNDDQEDWGQYGGTYGGFKSYYKDRNEYTTSRNYWQPNLDSYERPDPPYGVKPQGTYPIAFDYSNLGRTEGYGSWKRGYWNSSGTGPGLSYGESNYYRPAKLRYPAERRDDAPVAKDCSSRRQPGVSLGSGAIRQSLLASNVVECEAACFNEKEFKCVSYSFRYSNSQESDNCFLSERPYRGLDLASDSGSDVYALPENHGCPVDQQPWVESECFWHVRSESAVSGAAVKASLTVPGLGACEAECIRAHGFFCRGFSFRFDSPRIGDEAANCRLTSSPPTGLTPDGGLSRAVGHELYSRGNYGRGCEPALYDEAHSREKECYLQYDNAAKLTGSAVKGRATVKDEESCGLACTEAPFSCLSFSFNNAAAPGADNCLLSEIRLFDLQRGVDYEHSTDDWLFAFDLFNGKCARQRGKTGHLSPPQELPRPLPSSEHHAASPSGSGYLPGPVGPPGSAQGRPASPAYIPGTGLPSGPGYNKPVYPASPPSYHPAQPYPPTGFQPAPPPYSPGYKPEYPVSAGPSYPGYDSPTGPGYRPGYHPSNRPSGPGFKPGYAPPSGPDPGYGPPEFSYGPRPSGPGYAPDEEPVIVSWRHYTVSGFPCKKGTTCAQNQIAGHWACEPEAGEIGSWDYCCAPNHRCGYSEGFHKPWCYVGRATDQWRPCSEKYYPYHQHNVPHPSQNHRDDNRPHYNIRPARPAGSPYLPLEDDRTKPSYFAGPYLPEADRKYWDDLYRNGPKAYYDQYGNPLPGYSRVPMEERPYIKYQHNYPPPGSGHWEPVHPPGSDETLDPPVPGGLGVPRYWPVAYLHKGPPPNITYFRYNETDQTTTTTHRYDDRSPIVPPRPQPPPEFGKPTPENYTPEARTNFRDEKTRNITRDQIIVRPNEVLTSTTPKLAVVLANASNDKLVKGNKSSVDNVDMVKLEVETEKAKDLKGIDGKLDDFSGSIEVLDIEDAKSGGQLSDVKTLEAEERQIEAIGRLLASKRGGQLILEKRSQKELEAKNIAVDDFNLNFGNKFPTNDRKGTIQKVTKEEILKDRELSNEKSLEVSETTFVRPPRVLSTTTDNIRKAMVNGKVFYDATVREQRDLYANHSRKLNRTAYARVLEDSKAPSVISNNTFGKKKNIRARNVNPVRRVRRIYKKRYNPEEVRRRLLEREKEKKEVNNGSVVKIG